MLRNAEFTQPETVRACRHAWPRRSGTPCSRNREHATQRTPWPTRFHWQDWHQYHRQFHLVAFTDRCPRATDHWPLFSRPAPHAAGRELGLFSGSIPPSFVLSHNMPMINTTSNWLRFGAFQRGPAESTRRCADSTSRLHGDGYGCHAHAQSKHGARRLMASGVFSRGTGAMLTRRVSMESPGVTLPAGYPWPA